MKEFDFLHSRRPYQGRFTPENLAFNANLQEFAQRVSYICQLANDGQLSAEESERQIEALLAQLKRSKQLLGIGKPK